MKVYPNTILGESHPVPAQASQPKKVAKGRVTKMPSLEN